ncbi:MAG: hypothetical protein KatS3mg105_4681 [Gemmatales bacterium]|nr:MAG: hypothetical protein KatS3mg105_4681 [Gemmatales bacterium]
MPPRLTAANRCGRLHRATAAALTVKPKAPSATCSGFSLRTPWTPDEVESARG